MCLDEIEVDGRKFLGLTTQCQTRIHWVNAKYLTLTEDEHYGTAANGTVPAETQKWVMMTSSGCMKMLRDEFPLAGDLIELDSQCTEADASHDTEFFALTHPRYLDQSLNEIEDVFSIVDAHQNNSRRYSYFINQTLAYVNPETGSNCSCVNSEEGAKLGTLLTSRRHMHRVHEDYEHSYWSTYSECDGHIFRLYIFPPSPPPPEGLAPPPAPPLFYWTAPVAVGSFAVSGLWLCFCFICCGACVGGRVYGRGRSKWWGVREMRIDRHPIGGGDASDNVIFNTGSRFLSGLPPASVPLLDRRVGNV